MNWFGNVWKGYAQLFKAIILVFLFILLSTTASALIVLPLYWFSGQHPKVYTWITMTFFFGVIILYYIIIKRNQIKSEGGWKEYSKRVLIPNLKKDLLRISLVIMGLLCFFLWNNSTNLILIVPLTLVFIVLLGLGLHSLYTKRK